MIEMVAATCRAPGPRKYGRTLCKSEVKKRAILQSHARSVCRPVIRADTAHDTLALLARHANDLPNLVSVATNTWRETHVVEGREGHDDHHCCPGNRLGPYCIAATRYSVLEAQCTRVSHVSRAAFAWLLTG